MVSGKTFRIQPFEPQSASATLWDQFFKLDRALFKEVSPDPEEEPISREVVQRFMVKPDASRRHTWWMVLDGREEQMVGFVQVSFMRRGYPEYEQNKHIAQCNVRVAPDHRRQGLGTQLLQTILSEAREKNVTLLQANATHETGHAFCQHFDGQVAIEGAENRLKLDDVDWDMIETWQREGPQRAPGVSLEMFGDVPETDIDSYTRLYTETMNQQPMGELEGKMKITPQSRRTKEREMRQKGIVWLTKVSREKNGAISGLTELLYTEEEPHKAFQNLTGVGKVFRGRGLGKWLKAAMLLHVRQHYPKVKCIITGNADVNAPMLSINERMGFKPFLNNTFYQFKTEALCQKVGTTA